jgi:YVTN family beta-propeller protein
MADPASETPCPGESPIEVSRGFAIAKKLSARNRLFRALRAAALVSLLALLICTLEVFSLGCRRRPAPPKPYVAFVVNNQSATLAAVNLADFRVTASVGVAPQPERILVRPGSRQLYVVSATGKINVVTHPNPRVITTLDVGRSAKDLAFSPDGRSAYVLDPADSEVIFLDCDAGKETARIHLREAVSDLALAPDGKTLVVASPGLNRLTFLSTQTRQPLAAVEVGQGPSAMVILPDSSIVFVADTGEEKVSAVNVATQKLLSNIEIGTRPTALLLKPDGGEIFVLSAQTASLVIVDAFHDNVEQTFPTGREPVAGVFRQDSSVLYIANAGDGSVMALDVQNRAVLASTHVGVEPRALALTPDERFLLVVDSAASSLAVMHADAQSLANGRSALVTTVPVGTQPVDVVVPDWLEK